MCWYVVVEAAATVRRLACNYFDSSRHIYSYNGRGAWKVSSDGLVVKHPALGVNGRRFEPRKRSKLLQGLISRLTTSWVADHVKWRCRLH